MRLQREGALEEKRRRVLALGIDAGDLDYLEARRRHLPAFDRLLDGRRYLPAAPRALSGSVWPTFYCGRHPGHHGIYQHLLWDAERMGLRRISPDWCAATPFWQRLEERGADLIVVDVPYSFPGFLKRGVAVTDWGTHGQTHPLAGNRQEVDSFLREFGRGIIGRETPVGKSPRQLGSIARELCASAGRKGELIAGLVTRFPWDLCIAVFGESHRAGHVLFEDGDERGAPPAETPLLEVYRAIDGAIAEILDAVDTETTRVLLFSVHGMMRDNAQGHLVRPVMRRINAAFVGGGEPVDGGIVRRLRGRVPARLQHAVGAAAPDRVREWVVEREIVGGIDWARTPGFALRTDIRTELRLNLEGRERRGLLPAAGDEHERYVERVRATFTGLRDAGSGERLVDEVVDVGRLYPGERSDRLPDLVVTWREAPPAAAVDLPGLGRANAQSRLEVEPALVRGGDHTDDGFAVLSGAEPEGELPPLDHTWQFADFLSHLTPPSAAR